MTKQIIPQEAEKSKKLNDALEALRNVYEPDVERLIYLIYELGGTQEQIAKHLKVARSTIAMKYPKKKEANHG